MNGALSLRTSSTARLPWRDEYGVRQSLFDRMANFQA
jgi:hypothetical protein